MSITRNKKPYESLECAWPSCTISLALEKKELKEVAGIIWQVFVAGESREIGSQKQGVVDAIRFW